MENKKTFITFGVVLVSVLGSANSVSAEQITVTIDGNGSSSNNEVVIKSETKTEVTQSNTANIENNIESNANTGDNTADSNTGGDTNIDTGDISANTQVVNSDINTNHAQASNGGQTGGSTSISGNGSYSQNSAVVNQNNATSVNQNNNANISNNVTTNANTGNNSANWNNGDATIKTGSIKAESTVVNKRINNSFAKINGFACDGTCQSNNEIILKIFGNGAGSINNINFDVDDNKTYDSTNLATIYNDIIHNLNTGGNSANGNNGDVAIVTGDIESIVTVINENINSNHVEIDCGCEEEPEKPEEPEEPTTPPTKPGNGNGNGTGGGNGNGGNGDVLGAAIGEVLPATGSLFLLWATLASLIMFFSGWYLRFRSGLAPGR